MEPITHFLTGACIGRAGLNRKTAYATLAAVLAAEAADIDILWGFAGPVEELKHHRGITHTFIAVPVVAAVAVGMVWVFNRWWKGRRRRTSSELNLNAKAPPAIRWGWLYLTALISALCHLLLDWTNNYGLRPFYPFNPRWYAGSFVFIFEPVLWALLLALTGMVLLWGWRWAEQGRARALVENTQIAAAPVKRLALEPYMINPFRWHAILETDAYYQTAEIDTRTGEIGSDPRQDVIFKPPVTAATEAAKRTLLGQVYLDWGTWAVVRDVGPEPIPGPVPGLAPPQLPPNRQWTTVEFTDLRFAYPFLGAGRTPSRPPLSGWVYIVDGRDDAGEAMDGRVQR